MNLGPTDELVGGEGGGGGGGRPQSQFVPDNG